LKISMPSMTESRLADARLAEREPTGISLTPDALSFELSNWRARAADFVTLSKPRIAVMVLVSVGVGFTLASESSLNIPLLLCSLLGIGLSAVASSVLNQWYERDTDLLMKRTAERPLPAGRISESEALWFGLGCALTSAIWLTATVNTTTALLTFATGLMYVAAYTPLKRLSGLCTTVGAVPGATPLVLGWTAAGGELNSSALVLFAILYVWQFPHFLAIAWIYQDQYRGAGLKMLPADGQRPALIGLSAAGHAAALIPVTLWARSLGLAGDAYALTAVILGCWYLLASVRFALEPNTATARKLLWTSLAYLPMLLAALTIDHVRLLR
jgi:protoheme IX farnesyltransferase